MADGMLCRNCGHQEASHFDFTLVKPGERLPGRKFSLNDCRGFDPENRKLAHILDKKNDEEHGQELTPTEERYLEKNLN